MQILRQMPSSVFVLSLLTLWMSARAGVFFRNRSRRDIEGTVEDLGLVLAATLTLLGLIIGFSFSMAINRYDQRKHYEEEEANAIGTEYLRADLLHEADAAKLKLLLVRYLDQRVLFYSTRDSAALQQVSRSTRKLEVDLWSAVYAPAVLLATPVAALAVAGMNDVINSNGYTQAAWWNRIPVAAWILMGAIAVSANFLTGYAMRRQTAGGLLLVILPLIVSISFFLIADIDSPRGGAIRVQPQNLVSLSESLRGER